jgi:hypothetical protein
MATKRKTVREEIAELREATHHEFVNHPGTARSHRAGHSPSAHRSRD